MIGVLSFKLDKFNLSDFISNPIFVFIFLLLVSVFYLILYLRKKDNTYYLVNIIIGVILIVPILIFLILFTGTKDGYRIMEYNKSTMITYLIFYLLSFFYVIHGVIHTSISLYYKELVNSLFIESLYRSPWKSYLVLTRKDKVSRISDDLLLEFGITNKKELIGKKLFDFLFQKIRVLTINGNTTDNKRFFESFMHFKDNVQKDSFSTFEISFYNAGGKEVFLFITVQPLYFLGKYFGLTINGEIKSGFDVMSLEKKFTTVKDDYNLLSDKFVALLEISDNGLVFYDITNSMIWASTDIVKILGLPDNDINIKDYKRLMHEEDLLNYEQTVSALTKERPSYSIKYRLFAGGAYQWFKESGKKIFTKDNLTIISQVTKINNKHFMASNLEVLDSLSGPLDMEMSINKLLQEQIYFQVIYFKIKNLNDINETHSREIGNMVLAEYVAKLNDAFVSEDSELFRVTGSTFGLLLTDTRKMSIIKEGLARSSDYLNLNAVFGSIKLTANVCAGVATAKLDSNKKEELIQFAKQALKFALSDKYKGNICYYSDIK